MAAQTAACMGVELCVKTVAVCDVDAKCCNSVHYVRLIHYRLYIFQLFC